MTEDKTPFVITLEQATRHAFEQGLEKGRRAAVGDLEKRGSLLCDCDPEANTPTNPSTKEFMDHHCECRAVVAAGIMLGGRRNTIHNSQCVCADIYDPPARRWEAMGQGGYGRYQDDPEHVGCPRAGSDMTPSAARDGDTACADDGACVGCGEQPADLLKELVRIVTESP